MTPAITVRVVAADLAVAPAVAAGLVATLPGPERGVSPRREVARAIARELLAETLGCAPGEVRLDRTCEHCGDPTHGRPRVAGAAVSFGLSHSGDVALVALVRGEHRVGIDVEVLAPRPRLDALASRVLSAGEHEAWVRLPAEDRLPAFLRAWTAREAYLKATGVGVTTALREVTGVPAGWTAAALAGPPGTIAAAAVDAPAQFVYDTWRAPTAVIISAEVSP